MKFFSLLLCIIVMVWCCQKTSADSAQSISIATDGLTEERMKNIKGVYCGSRLSGTISMICNYGGRIKRTNGGGYDGVSDGTFPIRREYCQKDLGYFLPQD
ncbi:uncharacterized protein LOC108741730 isoform X2 [Agrilus planipennis]|uniref:Uncharacterized protein LOC108741730 isoform X2 n=1 Tax=Agrilus planipennis TaxID=224129 RepID=A0A1W4XH67_AGRPL|nr:uncharacterized protein LOC108741730 isoform X2 [Agrilus planipennis]